MNDLNGLNYLLKAKSKTVVEKCLNITFVTRNSTEGKEACLELFQNSLEINSDEAEFLHSSVLSCISKSIVNNNFEEFEKYIEKYGNNINNKLKQLIIQIVKTQFEAWREAAIGSRISMPRLVDFDWTISLKKSSNEVHKMNEPCAIMSLTIEDELTSIKDMPRTNITNFELSREALQTLIDGYSKIRDQLSKMK